MVHLTEGHCSNSSSCAAFGCLHSPSFGCGLASKANLQMLANYRDVASLVRPFWRLAADFSKLPLTRSRQQSEQRLCSQRLLGLQLTFLTVVPQTWHFFEGARSLGIPGQQTMTCSC